MFGHQDDQNDHHDDQPIENVLTEPVADGLLSHEDHSAPLISSGFNPALPSNNDDQPGAEANASQDFPLPAGVSDDASAHEAAPVAEPAGEPAPAEPATAVSEPVATDTATPANDALLDIKQQALMQLSPLVDQLDQSPEEKFRTTMMMIQAADNQALVPKAYEAAQAITDEKVKAQALLDIVNEINYFTQHAA